MASTSVHMGEIPTIKQKQSAWSMRKAAASERRRRLSHLGASQPAEQLNGLAFIGVNLDQLPQRALGNYSFFSPETQQLMHLALMPLTHGEAGLSTCLVVVEAPGDEVPTQQARESNMTCSEL